MSMHQYMPDQAVLANSWTLFCPECAQKMRIIMAAPAQDGKETRTFECVSGHRERMTVALDLTGCRPSGGFSSFQQRYRSFPNALGQQPQDMHVKMIAASLSQPRAPTRLSTIRTTKDRANPLQPPVRDAMLAAVPRLRAFAISLCGKVDRADDLVQETLLRAIGSINSFQPGTNMCAWLFNHPPQPVPVGISQATSRSPRLRRQLPRQPEIASRAAQPGGIRGFPRRACKAAVHPARGPASGRRVGLLIRGGGCDL